MACSPEPLHLGEPITANWPQVRTGNVWVLLAWLRIFWYNSENLRLATDDLQFAASGATKK